MRSTHKELIHEPEQGEFTYSLIHLSKTNLPIVLIFTYSYDVNARALPYNVLMLEKIDIHLVDHCNLNCKGCTHFSPLAEKFFLDIDEFERDLTRFAELSKGEVGSIFMLGGEPLLHPEIVDFFPIARKLFPNTRLVIISNGILLSQMEERFWKACKRYNIQLWISKYDLSVDLSPMAKKAAEYGVFYGYTSTARTKQDEKFWTKCPLDVEGGQYWLNSYKHCTLKNCATLKHGKLYPCCTIAHIEHFNKFFGKDLKVSDFDYVDIYKVESWDTLLNVMQAPHPFCKYCKTTNYQADVWGTSHKDISEWT